MINNKVADFITHSGSWDLEKLRRAVVNFDIDSISIPINKDLEDKLIWHYDRIGGTLSKAGTRYT